VDSWKEPNLVIIPESATPIPEQSGQCFDLDTDLSNEVREAERRRIARELHDRVIQPLTALVRSLPRTDYDPPHADGAVLPPVAWRELAQEALDGLRAALAGQDTHPHAALGLPAALRQHLIPHFQGRGLHLSLESYRWPTDLPIDWTSNLYLAVREAVTNAATHGYATQVSIILQADDYYLTITVADNGGGCWRPVSGANRRARPGSGLGIQAMCDRVGQLGGLLQVTGAPGKGMRIEMRVPRANGQPPPGLRSTERRQPPGSASEHVH
jgi:signal transduction histidine kinase